MAHPRALLVAVALLLLATPAAAGNLVSVPAANGQKSGLKLRFVNYTGGASGQIVIDVQNPGQHGETFDARGLYFVPDGDPERAPQRLGAAGPFEQQHGDSWQTKQTTDVAPGQTVRLKLQVFCLDSHRGAPQAGQAFHLGAKRLPKELNTEIQRGAERTFKARPSKGEAIGEVQGHVWSTRNKKWIKLEGERAKEKSDPAPGSRRHHERLPVHRAVQGQSLE